MSVKADPNDSMRRTLDALPDVAGLFDLDGTILMVNAAGAAWLGRTRDNVVGRSISEFLPAEAAAFRLQLTAHVARTGQPAMFVEEKNGRWYERRVYPVQDEAGRVTNVAVQLTDVTERHLAEQQQEARSVELETIHAQVPVGILLIDAERRVTKANQAAANLAGVARDHVIGQIGGGAIGCLNHLDDPRGCGHGPECARCELRLAITSALDDDKIVCGLPVSVPVAGVDGPERIQVLVSTAPIALAGNRQVLVSLQDITPLRRAESDLAFKANVLDQIHDRVVVIDLEGRIVYVNNAACQSRMARREDLIGRRLPEPGTDSARGLVPREVIDRTLATGSWHGEIPDFFGSGADTILLCRTSLVHNEHGETVGLCCIATDVTESKRRETRLSESERRFRRLHEQLPMGYFALDRDGRYRDVNPAWLTLLGAGRDQVEGRRFAELQPSGHLERFAAARIRVEAGSEVQIEFEINRADGRTVTVFCVGRSSLDEQGNFETSHWVATDVSERRRLETQLWQAQKMDALGRLAAGVSHDFNNQLTVIAGYCDVLLASTSTAGPERQALEQIRRATERATSTTGHLLAFSRKRELKPRELDLNTLVRDLLQPVSKLIGENVRVRTELSPRLWSVCVDPGALQQALFNLIINANDAMPNGGSLIVRTSNRPHPFGTARGDSVELLVEDTGHGIVRSDLEHVFEPFFTTKPEGRGTGLGLSMVRGFAEQSGGMVEMNSQPGVGTTFRLVFPVAASAVAVAAAPPTSAANPRLYGRFLVVEDSDQVRELVVAVLKQRQGEVVEAASPEEALARAAEGPPFDVLITDVVMPGLRGDQLASRLLELGRVRGVVYMTGYQNVQLESCPGAMLSKPFTVSELVDVVERSLAKPAADSTCTATGGAS